MTEYYPLIGKAVAGLEQNTGEVRRQLYERARTALVDQLRKMNPPLTESEITRERLALEEAIRKVGAEAARRLSMRSKADAEPLPSVQQEAKRDPEPAVELVSAATSDARRRTAERLSNLSERLNQEEHGAQVEPRVWSASRGVLFFAD